MRECGLRPRPGWVHREVVARSKGLRDLVGQAHSGWEVFLGRLRCRQTLHAMAQHVVNI